ncbi:MAG: hypothetical protein PHP25_02140 [Candidatus Moranbacteria bacterium]|nr:hypothetical protein [Candidatus Moranbacteria bacterium]
MQKNFLKLALALLAGLLVISSFACDDSRDKEKDLLVNKIAKIIAERKAAYNKEVQSVLKQPVNSVPTIKIGDKALVPRGEWYPVKNPDGINNGNIFHEFNETCSIEVGGIIEVVGFVGNDLLMKYSAPDFKLTYGTSCPCGTALIVERLKFVKMTEKYGEIIRARDVEKNSIADALKKR